MIRYHNRCSPSHVAYPETPVDRSSRCDIEGPEKKVRRNSPEELVVGYQRKWTGPLWQGGVSESVVNYRKSYCEMSGRQTVAKKFRKPPLSVRVR